MAEPLRLKRTLTLLEATMIGLGPTIGPTIFVVPRAAIEAAGPAALFSFIIAGLFTLAVALNYAEMSSRIPEAGGGYSFAQHAFGGPVAFLAGWFMWLGNVAYVALSAATFAIAIAAFSPVPLLPVAGGAILVFTLLNTIGAKAAGRIEVLLTLFVTLVLVLFVIIGVDRINPGNLQPFTPYGWLPVYTTIGFVYSVFVGFEVIANASEEIKRAPTIVPRAILLTIVIALILFPLVVFTLLSTTSQRTIVRADAPLLTAAQQMTPVLAAGMVAGAVVASLASLNAAMISSSRTVYALARDHHLPHGLVALHARWRTPYPALLTTTAVALLFLLGPLDLMVYVTALGYLFGLTVINAAALRLPRGHGRFRLPAHPLIPLVATVTTLLMLPTISVQALGVGAAITAFGVLLRFLHTHPRQR